MSGEDMLALEDIVYGYEAHEELRMVIWVECEYLLASFEYGVEHGRLCWGNEFRLVACLRVGNKHR